VDPDRDAPPPPPSIPVDRDGDGVADGQDACPDVAGVRTDDARTNGCPPDPDRDQDGILNEVDACPDAAGPKSDDPGTTGCPRVSIKNARIQILEQPKFDVNQAVIKKESDSLLAEVAQVMNDHLEIRHVTVEGHTDSAGGSELNKILSEQRAEAVVKWLVSHGVSVGRLSARGMGKDEPIMPNDTDAGRAANRRVEFHIEMQDPTTHEQVAP
jgi:OOP family OmpA-OmpF porin